MPASEPIWAIRLDEIPWDVRTAPELIPAPPLPPPGKVAPLILWSPRDRR